jgi:hypothetical protein
MKYKLTSKPISEKDIKHQVKQYLDLKGWFHFHLLAGMGAFKGCPDRVAIKNGQVYFLEIKKPKGSRQSENQKLFQERLEKAGCRYVLIKNLEDLIEALEGGEK